MRLDFSTGLPLLIVALSMGSTASRGADGEAVAMLKAKGLVKNGSLFVIDQEREVLAQLKASRSALVQQAEAAEQRLNQELVATRLTELEDQRQELQNHLTEMNQKILEQTVTQAASNSRPGPGGMSGGGFNGGGMGGFGGNTAGFGNQLTQQRDQIKENLSQIVLEQKTLKTQAVSTQDRPAQEEQAKKTEEATRKTLGDLRTQVDAVTRKYTELGADPAVKKALAELSRAAKTPIRVGPTAPFLAEVRVLNQAERQLLGKTTVSNARKKKSRAHR